MKGRNATKSDWPRINHMCKQFASTVPWVDYSDDAFGHYCTGLMEDPNGFLQVCGDPAYAVLAGTVSRSPFSGALVSVEIVLWVDENHRGSFASRSLITSFKEWSIKRGCSVAGFSALDDRAGRYFELLGMKPRERFYGVGL